MRAINVTDLRGALGIAFCVFTVSVSLPLPPGLGPMVRAMPAELPPSVELASSAKLLGTVLPYTVPAAATAQQSGSPPAIAKGSAIGVFEGHHDVGTVRHAGSVVYDAGKH